MAEHPRLRGIPPELSVVALVGAAAVPMTRLFAAGPTGANIVLAILFSGLVAWGTRKLRLPAIVAVVLSLLALMWFVAVRFFPDTLAGPFPSGTTVRAMIDALHEGARQINQEVAPVQPTPPLLMFVVIGVWLTTWLVDTATLAVTNPLLGVASAIPLFVVPGGLVISTHLAIETALFVAAAAWLVYTSERGRMRHSARAARGERGARIGWRPGVAARVAIVVLLLMALVTPALPGFGGTPVFRAHGSSPFGVHFNPLVMIKPTLDNRENIDLFTAFSDVPVYYRLTALDHFDGKAWSQSRRDNLIALDAGFNEIGAAGTVGTTTLVRQQITIDRLAGPWLPATYDPYRLVDPESSHYEPDTSTLLADHDVHTGLSYQVQSLVPNVDPQTLDTPVSYDDPALKPYLQLPGNTPQQVKDIAHRIADGASTPFRKAVALQDYLRGFTYDENVAAGHSFSSILEFLTKVKRGYCEQFAATMATLARVVGLPSRVVIGFATGIEVRPHIYEVTTRYAHAWVEIYFPQAGWLTFEPTPRSDVTTVPAYAQVPVEIPTTQPSDGPTTAPNAATPQKPKQDTTVDANQGGAGASGLPWWALVLIGVAAVGAAGAGSLAFLRARRRRSPARAPASDVVAARYVDFLGWCRATGYGRRDGETPREHAERVGARVEAAREPLSGLARMAEIALWAPPNGLATGEFEELVAGARDALAKPLSRRARARGAIRFSRN